MTYVIYNLTNDTNDFVTDSLESVLMRAGELIDQGDTIDYQVLKYTMTYDDYMDALDVDDHLLGSYSVKGFVEHFGSEKVPEAITDIFRNLDQNEQLEVLKFIPDHMLIGELRRRFDEYRRYAKGIRDVGDRMRLYV